MPTMCAVIIYIYLYCSELFDIDVLYVCLSVASVGHKWSWVMLSEESVGT